MTHYWRAVVAVRCRGYALRRVGRVVYVDDVSRVGAGGVVVVGVGGPCFEVGDALLGAVKLDFEVHDAGGGCEGHVLVEQRADACGEVEFDPAVATLPAG